LFFSNTNRAFLCSKRTFERIDAEYGITKKLSEEGLEDEIFYNIDSFVDVAISGETITVTPSIGAPIELDLTEWGMWFSYEKLKDFDLKSDWGAELLKHIKITALDVFVDTMTQAVEERQKQLEKE
jgi:predicted nucleotide-binding protein (sugar kinase/HSP70/actin superfamily)